MPTEPDTVILDVDPGPDLIVVGVNVTWPCSICGHTIERGEHAVINRLSTRHKRCVDRPPRPKLTLIRGGLHEQLELPV